MKYIIDLPDDYDRDWIAVHMPMEIKQKDIIYKRSKVLLEPYKPELEKEVFDVGDEVTNSDGKYSYVLVPNYERDNEIMILLMDGYAMPQMVRKIQWKKTGKNNQMVKKLVRFAYGALNEVTE